MPSESLLLTVLCVLAAVAFIGVLNARGPWRTGFAAALALACLVAALWRVTEYRAARHRPFPQPPASVASPGKTAAPKAPASEVSRSVLLGLLADSRSLQASLTAEDPTTARSLPDSEYQAFERRAVDYLSTARDLKERAAALERASTLDTVTEPLGRALESLNDAAGDLRAFFRAIGRDEEEERTGSFRKNLDAAAAPLDDAESRAQPFPGF